MHHKDLVTLRTEVREYIDEHLRSGTFVPTIDCWVSSWNEEFTRALARRGWVGMTIPKEYGGHGRGYLERYVVTEELLSAGAPVAAHWIADRQIAPSLLRYGTEAQKREFLPKIANGEMYFAIGMSEPESGSDLASVKSTAARVKGGWKLNGTKIWTGGAHRAHAFIALVRTTELQDVETKHAGLSQFIVRLDAPGIVKEPIHWIDGTHHFNRVIFKDVFIPDSDVLGEIGQGWSQVLSELKFERSGPERILSSMPALESLLAAGDPEKRIDETRLGRHIARLGGLHSLSFEVARGLQDGESPEILASMVKVLGTNTESDVVDDVAEWSCGLARLDGGLAEITNRALMRRPGFTLRGGSNEILRGIIAKGLGKSTSLVSGVNEPLLSYLENIFEPEDKQGGIPADPAVFSQELWEKTCEIESIVAGCGTIPVTQSWSDMLAVLHTSTKYGAVLPVVEHYILADWLSKRLHLEIGSGITTVAWNSYEVPWGRYADTILIVDSDRFTVTRYHRDDLRFEERNNLAGVANDRIIAVQGSRETKAVSNGLLEQLRLRGALARAIQIVTTLSKSINIAYEHAKTRYQFGQPLIGFQAVQALLADGAAEQALARSATLRAVRLADDPSTDEAALRSAISLAKAISSEAVGTVVKNAHQVLGAIGVTRDHELHHFTLPALAWSMEYGTSSDWAREIGILTRQEGLTTTWRRLIQETQLQPDSEPEAVTA